VCIWLAGISNYSGTTAAANSLGKRSVHSRKYHHCLHTVAAVGVRDGLRAEEVPHLPFESVGRLGWVVHVGCRSESTAIPL
jgi:hypothetical protein